jgi:preprotein translocase subunit SecA
MVGHLREQVTGQLMRIEVVFQQPEAAELPPMFAQHLDPATGENEMAMPEGAAFGAGPALGFAAHAVEAVPVEARDPNDPNSWGRVGRNEVCPCGSGKKYKHCHGRFVA